MAASRRPTNHEEPSVLLTELNVPLMLLPRAPTIETQATTMSASMTAYSTAVGPSSLTTKRCTFEMTPRIVFSSSKRLKKQSSTDPELVNVDLALGLGNLGNSIPSWRGPLDRRIASPGSMKT
jgi:hypothetical protein